MSQRILVTGGAGFIGRHVIDALVKYGHSVRVLDSLIEQVHADGRWPAELPADAETIIGDVRDAAAVRRALAGVDKVIHLAAEVGVGQSMYAIERYVSTNEIGTAVLFEELIRRPVARIVTASSMSVYGEGLYETVDGGLVDDVIRGPKSGDSFDPPDAEGRPMKPVRTPETKRPALNSIYALTKYAQERQTLMLAPAYGMEGVALRMWNAYGPGQALSNPYTGVLAIFASRIANGQPPMIFEDGRQQRDFIHVGDVVQAFLLALDHENAPGQVYNVGSGEVRTVTEVAKAVARAMGREDIEPQTTGDIRAGDIRHCIPDISKIERMLGYRARHDFDEGCVELAEWVAHQEACDRVADARRELAERGLVA